jgi:hypothetical protein
MAILDRLLGRGQQTQQQQGGAELSVGQEEESLSKLRAGLDSAYQRPDAAGLQERVGEVASQIDGVQQRLGDKASGDARYADTKKLLEAALNQPDHIQRGANLIGVISACDQAMSKSGVDQGLLKDTKEAAKKLLELGKNEADLAQQEVRARVQARRVATRRSQQAIIEQKKQATEQQQRREKQEEDIGKSLNASAAQSQALAARTKSGAAKINGAGPEEEYLTEAEQGESTISDANAPAGAVETILGRDGPADADRSADGNGLGLGGGDIEESVELGSSTDAARGDDEFIEFMVGERRRRVKKRKPDGSLVSLDEILEEGLGIDQINILEFIQDPVLLKYFDIAINRQLGEIRQRYGEDAIILWTITELARAIIAQGLKDKGISLDGLPPSLSRPRTPTEEAVAEACQGAMLNYVN